MADISSCQSSLVNSISAQGSDPFFHREAEFRDPTHAKWQVLVVDDDPSVRESVAMTLVADGYDVVVAEDEFQALSQLRKKGGP